MQKRATFFLLFFLLVTTAFAQITIAPEWMENIGEDEGVDAGQCLFVDGSDNIYIGGNIEGANVDLDGTEGDDRYTTGGTTPDAFIAKYNSSGEYQWGFTLKGDAQGKTMSIYVDGTDIYVTGYLESTTAVDMDPSTNSNTVTPNAGGYDGFVAKYDGSVDPTNTSFYQWAFTFGGTGADYVHDVKISGTDLYLGGVISGTGSIDMDPSTNTNNIAGAGGYDGFAAKYDASTTPSNASFYDWAFDVGGGQNDYCYSIEVSGNDVYIGGVFRNVTADFDPSTNTNSITATSNDGYVAKYDGSLTPSSTSFYQWAFDLGCANSNGLNDIELSGTDLYVTGHSYDCSMDMDPSTDTWNLSSPGGLNDIYLAKYDVSVAPSSTSFLVWAFDMGTSSTGERGDNITIDGTDVYFASRIRGTTNVDFDPSTNTANHTAGNASTYDFVLTKYDGTQAYNSTNFHQWSIDVGTTAGSEYIRAVGVSGSNLVAIGFTTSTGLDMDPGAGTETINAYDTYDIMVGFYTTAAGAYADHFKIGNSGGDDDGRAVAVDASGNMYSIGSFEGELDLDPGSTEDPAISNGGSDVYVVKYNSSGTFQWGFGLGSTTDDIGLSMAVSGDDVYISGYLNGSSAIDMDPSTNTNNVTPAGGRDAFLAKYDGSLTPDNTSFYQWSFVLGGTLADRGYGLNVSGNDVYLVGNIEGTSAIDMDPSTNTNNITGAGNDDIYVAKYDGSLDPTNASFYQWAFRAGGTDLDRALDVEISGSDIYVTGAIRGTSAIDMDPSTNTNNITGAGNDDIFVAKYDGSVAPSSASFYTWAFRAGGTGHDVSRGVEISGNDLYIGGSINGTSAIDMDPSTNTNNITGAGSDDVFAAKYDASLSPSSDDFYQWAFEVGGTGSDVGRGIAESDGDIFITGNINGTSAIDMDPSANTNNITGAGGDDIFVAIYDGAKDPSATDFWHWAFRTGGTTTDRSYGIDVDASNDYVITGSYLDDQIDFDPSGGTSEMSADIGGTLSNSFIGKYQSGTPLPVTWSGFEATLQNKVEVLCSWSTASEQNNDYFTIERSLDGVNFEGIGTVDGSGNSSVANYYSFIDDAPAIGINYYRIKQTDYDGKFEYTTIRNVLYQGNAEYDFSVYPNPASKKNLMVNLSGERGQEVLLVVHDMFGREYYAKAYTFEDEMLTVQLAQGFDLAAGLYIITASSSNKLYKKKVVVK